MTNFSDWLTSQLATKKISPAELSRRMHKDPGLVSRMLRGERNPSTETLKSVANALQLSDEEVFSAAGILDPMSDNTARTKQVEHLLNQLPQDEQNGVIEFIKLRLKLSKDRDETKRVHKRAESTK